MLLISTRWVASIRFTGLPSYVTIDCLDMFQWIASQLVEEDKERVRGLKEDLLEEAQRELIRV